MVSEPLDAEELRRALRGRRFGSELSVVADTGSTNGDLRAAAIAGAPDGAVLMAEHQSAGRGRSGRVWESAPGQGLLMSALLVPGPPFHRAPLCSLAAGVAACDAVEAVVPTVAVGLKWPNDVMAGGGKLGGILVEGELVGDEFVHVLIGLGLNANHTRSEVPEGGTSLGLLMGRPISRARLVVSLLVALEERLADLDQPDRLLSAYRERCLTLGEEVRVERRAGSITGTALDVDHTGALVVATEYGLETVGFGDVVHLRTTEGGRA